MYKTQQKDFAQNPELIKQMLYLDRPDVVVTAGVPEQPVVGIEVSAEAMTGHDAFQRFSRIVAALEFGTPFAYFLPMRKWVRRERSSPSREGWDHCNPLVFQALLRATRIHNVPALAFVWAADENRGDPNEGYLRCHKGGARLPDAADPEFRAMGEFISLAVEHQRQNRPFLEMLNTEFFFEREMLMWGWFHERQRSAGKELWSPLTACTSVPTDQLGEYVRQAAPGVRFDVPNHILARGDTCVYCAGARDFRSDPYAGALVAVDYLKCRNGPTVQHRHTNLGAHFPGLSINDVVESAKSYYDRRCALKYTASEARCNRYYSLHLREGCRYTKPKWLRVICSFADIVIFRDGVLI